MSEIVAAVLGAVLGGWVTWLLGARDRKRAWLAQEELRLIKRRAEAPCLCLWPEMVMRLNVPALGGHGLRILSGPNARLLCANRREIPKDCPVGTDLFMMIQNTGNQARFTSVEIDGTPAILSKEPDLESARGLEFLSYRYDPAKHGQAQTLRLTFEAASGVQDTHLYKTIHGCYALERIDPPLPK
jgi:hypothetical protein